MKHPHALHCQQGLLRTPGVKEDFEKALGAIQASVSNPNKITCQLCYAWPSEENKVNEYWVQPFLLELRRHLRLAGIHALLDIADNQSGGDIRQFAKRAKTSDYTLLFCTPSLVTKLDVGKAQHVIQLEFTYLKEKLKNDGSQVKVFPFLIAGTPEESAPPEFKTFVTTREWQGKSYVHCLKDLINSIHPEQGNILDEFMEKHIGFKTLLTNSQVETELQKKQYEQEQAKLEQADWYQRLKALQESVSLEEIYVARKKYGVPNRNEKFVGRVEHLMRIEDQFKQSKNTEHDTEAASPVVITAALNGMGGVGKSQLALQYIYSHEEQYPKIFWFIAETEDRLKQEYQSLGLELKLYPEETKLDDAVRITKNWLEQTNGWLAVYDNVPNYTEIKSLLPQKQGRILITSRYTHWKLSNKNITPIRVDVFTEEEALSFMREQLKERMESEDGVIASKALLSLLGNLPLALAQACAYMNQSEDMSVQEYLELYRVYRKDFLERNDLEGEAEPEVVAIALIWEITVERIRTIKPEAETLLNFISYLNADRISASLLHEFMAQKNITNVLDVRDIINVLVNYSMLKREEDKNYGLHRLVQEVLRDKHSIEESVGYLLVLSNIIRTIYPDGDDRMAQTELKKTLIPHIEQGLALSNMLLKKFNEQESELSSGKQVQESMRASIELLEKNIKQCFLHCLGKFHFRQSQAVVAKNYWEELLKLKRSYCGDNHVEIVEELGNLALAEGALGNHADKRDYLLQVLAIQMPFYGSSHVEVAKTFSNLGNASNALGSFKEAKEYHERALEIYKKCYSNDHVEVANALGNLGTAYGALGDPARAKEYFEQDLEIQRSYYREDHIAMAAPLNNLAGVSKQLGNLQQAKKYMKQALKITRNYYGESHFEVARTLSNLAEFYLILGSKNRDKKALEKANNLVEESLKILSSHPYCGSNSAYTKIAENNLSLIQNELASIASSSQERIALNEILLNYKTSVEMFLPTPEKALRRASSLGNADHVKVLLNYISDLNVQDTNPNNQKTALHWAVIRNHIDVVKILLGSGARFDIPDAENKTAYDYANELSLEEIKSLFDELPDTVIDMPPEKRPRIV